MIVIVTLTVYQRYFQLVDTMKKLDKTKADEARNLLAQGCSLRDVADKVGVHYSTVSRLRENLRRCGEEVEMARVVVHGYSLQGKSVIMFGLLPPAAVQLRWSFKGQ